MHNPPPGKVNCPDNYVREKMNMLLWELKCCGKMAKENMIKSGCCTVYTGFYERLTVRIPR